MEKTTSKIRFDKSGYYFAILIVTVVWGFWRSYFSKFVDGTNKFSDYFHFHAVMMAIWVVILIVQPILIRKKQLAIHRVIGKISYFVMPVLLLSVLFVLNSGLKIGPKTDLTFMTILFPFRDIWLLAIFFTVGVIYRHNINIHARAMVVTGIVFIEPSLMRALGHTFGQAGALATMVIVVGLLITLIILERKQKSARWIFPSVLAAYVIAYALLVSQVQLQFLDPLVVWFSKLPLT